jgi:hypothetical protein
MARRDALDVLIHDRPNKRLLDCSDSYTADWSKFLRGHACVANNHLFQASSQGYRCIGALSRTSLSPT